MIFFSSNYAALTYSVPSPHEAPSSLHSFTEEELMLKDTVSRFAREVVQPKVSEMDEAELMDKNIIKAMFDNGVSSQYGKNFSSSMLKSV